MKFLILANFYNSCPKYYDIIKIFDIRTSFEEYNNPFWIVLDDII